MKAHLSQLTLPPPHSKYFDVSEVIKSLLALHRTLRQLDFPISAGECIVLPGWAQLGALRSLLF